MSTELAVFRVVFVGDAWHFVKECWTPMKVTEIVNEVRLNDAIATFQDWDLYRGKIVSIERLYRRA